MSLDANLSGGCARPGEGPGAAQSARRIRNARKPSPIPISAIPAPSETCFTRRTVGASRACGESPSAPGDVLAAGGAAGTGSGSVVAEGEADRWNVLSACASSCGESCRPGRSFYSPWPPARPAGTVPRNAASPRGSRSLRERRRRGSRKPGGMAVVIRGVRGRPKRWPMGQSAGGWAECAGKRGKWSFPKPGEALAALDWLPKW